MARAAWPRLWLASLGRFRTWPLTWRLLAVLLSVLLAALAMSSLATYGVMRSYLLERTNEELRVAAEGMAFSDVGVLYHVSNIGVPSSYAVVVMDRSGGARFPVYATDERDMPDFPALPITDPRVTSGTPFTVPSTYDSTDWQVVAGRLADGSGTFAVAASLRGVDLTLTRLQLVSIAIGLLVTALCFVLGWLGVRRAFRPLRDIEDTASAIADGDLGRRIPEHLTRDEVGSLAKSLNAMLAQIETSFAVREASEERMRRFVTDASHELRTPLATVRGYAELYRQGAAAGPEATAGAMRRIEDEASRMSGLVEDLLTLARLDDHRPPHMSEVDLTVLAADAVQDAKAREPGRSVRLVGLGSTPLGPTELTGDEARLRQVVTNLLANALHHTPPDSPVEVAVGRVNPKTVRLEVRDHGPGVPAHEVDRLFERFYRGDQSRGRAGGGGTGLGLAIVMAIVVAHEGRVGVRQTTGGGATFVVELPKSPTAQRTPTPALAPATGAARLHSAPSA